MVRTTSYYNKTTDQLIGQITTASMGNWFHGITMVGLSLQAAAQAPSPFSLKGGKREERSKFRWFEAQCTASRIVISATLIKALNI